MNSKLQFVKDDEVVCDDVEILHEEKFEFFELTLLKKNKSEEDKTNFSNLKRLLDYEHTESEREVLSALSLLTPEQKQELFPFVLQRVLLQRKKIQSLACDISDLYQRLQLFEKSLEDRVICLENKVNTQCSEIESRVQHVEKRANEIEKPINEQPNSDTQTSI